MLSFIKLDCCLENCLFFLLSEWNALLLLNPFKHCCICAAGSRAASCGEPAAARWIRSLQRAGQQRVDSTPTPQTLWSATRREHQPRKLRVQPQPELRRAQRCGAGGARQTTQCTLAGAYYCCAHKRIHVNTEAQPIDKHRCTPWEDGLIIYIEANANICACGNKETGLFLVVVVAPF